MTDFKYDVAFSFLFEDEELVSRIHELIRDRFEVFFSPKGLREIAGKDAFRHFVTKV